MSASSSNSFPFNIHLHFEKIIDFKSFNQTYSQFLLSKHNALLNININEDETLLNSSILTEESILNLSNNNNSSSYSDIKKIVDIMQ